MIGATRYEIDQAIGPIAYDCFTGQLDRFQGTEAWRKPLALLGLRGLDAARTLLIDDGREHWSGQHNQIAAIPGPPYKAGTLDLDAVWQASLEHVERSFEQPDVRLAPRFYWNKVWFKERRRIPGALELRELVWV